ncbi:hypothetical protein J3R83DRAFT_8086 [Lanmaoa asiatica]|nr:hypothetical protein J3R83DRAFT_8086 [Lanmaoa asiatica]
MDSKLYDALQAKFCPLLDTSLLAALIADLDLSQSSPPSGQLDALRTTLKELAIQATAQHEYELADEIDSAHLSPLSFTTDESASSPDFCAETTECSTASDSSAISHQSFSSPLGFLQAALPHIPPSRLRRALSEAGTGHEADVDMEPVVELLLTNEFIRELEERGLDALDDSEQSPYTLDDDLLWKRVEAKKKYTPANGKAAKKKNARGKTIPLIDIRQKQHLPPPAPAAPLAPDPWTQLASLSERLATLLPSHSATFFQSHFHSPNHVSPARALRAALSSIAGTQSKSPSYTATTAPLFTMLDVLRDSPTYTSLDTEQRSTLYTDAQLALRATRGRADDAIDIVWLLLELELDLASGTLAMGVYHVPKSPLSPSRSFRLDLPNRNVPAAAARESQSKCQYQWGDASTPERSHHLSSPRRRRNGRPSKGPHPLALHIPAYDSTNQSRRSAAGKARGSGNGMGKGGKGDVGELMRPDLRRRMATTLRKRDELLREASKAWSRGNSKTRGGEVALYFAERVRRGWVLLLDGLLTPLRIDQQARDFQELARREALNEARIMVESKRSAAADHNTVDLHGTSISEAIVIVKEILEHEVCSAMNPLRIITGRGTHSANGVGVLKPAVRNSLVRDGWNVGVWDGGLVVRGRT